MGFPFDTKVLTESGWKDIQEIEIGENLINSNNELVKVISKNISKEPLYRVTLTDNVSFIAGDNQKFPVVNGYTCYDSQLHKRVCNKLKQIKPWTVNRINNHLLYKKSNIRMKVLGAVDLKKDSILPIDPYILGLLLGDGCFKDTCHFVSADKELMDSFINFLNSKGWKGRYENHLSKNNTFIYNAYIPQKWSPGLKNILEELALWGKVSSNKFIPDIYKNTSIFNRISILQGLLDTDGFTPNPATNSSKNLSFCTISPILATDVQYIARSLGAKVRITIKENKYKNKEDKLIILPGNLYILSINFRGNSNIIPFRLKRKVDRYLSGNFKKRDTTQIVNCEKIDAGESFSLEVEGNNYIIDNFIGVLT